MLIDHGDKTASHYEIKEIQGQRYMFIEWKSGNVTILGRKPMYYVLRWSGSASAQILPPTVKARGRAVSAQIRLIEVPVDLPLDLAKLDLAAIAKNPDTAVLAAPRMISLNGEECEIKLADLSTLNKPAMAKGQRPLLDGETVHYTVKLSVSVAEKSSDGLRTTVHDLCSGDARLDQPVVLIVEAGQWFLTTARDSRAVAFWYG